MCFFPPTESPLVSTLLLLVLNWDFEGLTPEDKDEERHGEKRKTRQREAKQAGRNFGTLEKTLSIKGSAAPFMFLL